MTNHQLIEDELELHGCVLFIANNVITKYKYNNSINDRIDVSIYDAMTGKLIDTDNIRHTSFLVEIDSHVRGSSRMVVAPDMHYPFLSRDYDPYRPVVMYDIPDEIRK